MSSEVKSWRSTRHSLATLAPGATAILLVLAGLLGVSQPVSAANGKLVNISTRALVETGDEVMIGGFIIADSPKTVLVQARGTELANDDSSLTGLLADPVLSIISNDTGEELMANDNWEDSQGQGITEAWQGSPNLMAGSLSAAAIITLGPGNYTAIVRGKNVTTGLAQVEVYDIDSPGSGSPDREALAALYNGTDGANWRRSDNWGTEAPLDQWYGVTDDGNGRVIELDLRRNQLSGAIPAELGNLTNLEVLGLFDNQLSGPIPAELGRLTGLEILNLSRNQLSGPIPVELGNLANLEVLALSDNQLNGPIPAELRRLTNLEGLFLFRNELSGPIPAWLGELSNLQRLSLTDNQLSGQIPVQLSELSILERLYLGDNQLSGPIPAALSELSNLQFLYLNDNQLSGPIPVELGELANLVVLYLSKNQLSGPIPAELGNLPNLEVIYLRGNQLSGCIPNGLQDVAEGDLSMLGLPFCGTISSDRDALVALYNATDGPNWANKANWLTETPLGDWEGVTTDATTGRVVGLDLRGNNLNGPLPAELGNLAELEAVYFGGNQLTGCIPNWLRDVSAGDLSTLGLKYCGTISSDRAALVALYNATDGPNWANKTNWLTEAPLGRWERVTTDATTGRVVRLDLWRNKLTGSIPAELGTLAKLEVLNLSENQLSGPIPIELGYLANLQELQLRVNQLTGPIPSELGTLANLQFLSLRNNQLSGPIPAELGNLANLQLLNLRGNQLSGPIPAGLGGFSNLRFLYLNDNQLSGPIPSELGNLANLEELDLSDNQLSGEILLELGNLANLRELRLYGNQLTGPIPPELGNFDNLEDIYISRGNQFSGCIPNGLQDVAEGDLSTLGLPYCGTIASDRAALVALYNATDGSNWANSANWLTEVPLGDWHGVTTDATTGRVVGIDLEGNNLAGTIPPELADLGHVLLVLDLSDNQLSGTIPDGLGTLTNLEAIHLGGNQFSGCIPNGLLDAAEGDLPTLGLRDCGTISSDRTALVALYNATDGSNWANSANWLTEVPLGDWHGVTTDATTGRVVSLDLRRNNLTGSIPSELGNLAYLELLWLNDNQLSEPIPSELGNLYYLEELYLNDNQLSGPIPPALGNLINLKWLHLSDNRLSGCIPDGLRDLAGVDDLSELGLSYCGAE